MLEYDGKQVIKKSLVGNGSFDSQECKAILEQSDIIITNPPFSLFRHYIDTIKDKDFLVIGSINSAAYKDIFQLIKDGKVRIGYNVPSKYTGVNGEQKGIRCCCWFTTLPVVKPELALTKKYNATDYSVYDNYPAINVNKCSDIPNDYKGAMGVPVTFIAKHNTGQYKLLDLLMNPIVGGKQIYKRILITTQ